MTVTVATGGTGGAASGTSTLRVFKVPRYSLANWLSGFMVTEAVDYNVEGKADLAKMCMGGEAVKERGQRVAFSCLLLCRRAARRGPRELKRPVPSELSRRVHRCGCPHRLRLTVSFKQLDTVSVEELAPHQFHLPGSEVDYRLLRPVPELGPIITSLAFE